MNERVVINWLLLIALILFWVSVVAYFNTSEACEWTPEMQEQFDKSIEEECKYIRCMEIDT